MEKDCAMFPYSLLLVDFFGLAGGLLGYVGPGAGLTMLGALAAVVGVLILALLAPILYPLRKLVLHLRSRRETEKPMVVKVTEHVDNN